MIEPLNKRTWHYVQEPSQYHIAPCDCGNTDTQWSEFAGHIWCANCQKDFIPKHNGIFDGPVCMELSKLMGICFDRVNLETGLIEPFDRNTP